MTGPEIFPPSGYYRLDEAYNLWFEKLFPHWKPSDKEIDKTREQCVNWLESHRDAVKIFTKDGRIFEVPASAWDRKWFPDMLVLHKSIPFSRSSPFAEYTGAILIVQRSEFDDWVELTRHYDVVEKPIDLVRERRWGVLPVLAWIATRDMGIAASAATPGATIRGESIRLSIRKATANKEGITFNWPCDDLDDAWRLHLAEEMTKGTIHCIADKVSQSKFGGISETVSGVIFPQQGAPAAALTHVVDDDNGTPTLVPSQKVFANSWRAWNNPLFERDLVLGLWPAPVVPIAIWDFAFKKGNNDKDLAGRLVAEIFAAFWKGELGVSELSLAESRPFNQPGVDTLNGLSREYLAGCALGKIGEQGYSPAFEQLRRWNIADYAKVDAAYRYYFVPEEGIGSLGSQGRGLCAPLDVLEAWLNKQSPSLSETVIGIEREFSPEVELKNLERPTDGDIANFFLETISKWSNDERPPNKDQWYALHRTRFKERALTSRDFHEIRTRSGNASVLPLYLRQSGNRQPGWQKNIKDDWRKRLGWQ